MSGVRPAVSDVDVDLAQLFGSLLRNWLRILIVALAITGLALMWVAFTTPLYRAETRILIENRESVFTRPNNVSAEAERPLLDEEAIASQVEVISSDDILRDVARDLNLDERDEFGASGETSTLGSVLILFGLKADPSQASVEERVVKAMRERLIVYRVDRSRVIVVQFSSADPELAAAVPNAIADAYIAVQEQAKLLSNADATAWLEPEIEDLRQRVRQAEARVADYRAQRDLLLGQNSTVLATQQLSELSSELTRVRAARAAAQAKGEAIRGALAGGGRMEAIPEVLNHPLVQRVRERQVQLEAEIADLSATLLPDHPRMRALDAQLAETDQQLRAEMGKVLRSVENEVSEATAREQHLVAELNGLKAQSARAAEDEVELRALEREATAQRALLESYLTRYREAASRADHNYLPADARVFSRAAAPYEPYFPKTLPTLAAAFAGSLLLMAIVTLLQELFSGRAMRPAAGAMHEPIEQVTMPAPQREPEVETPPAQETSAVERDEMSIAAAAEKLISSGASRAIFISPEGDEAAATSVMVAREIADSGLRVLFVDFTYSGAPSASMLESSRYPGITNLLASEAVFADIIRGDLYSDCHVIPVGTAEPAKAMRAVDRLPIIMTSLTTAYDLVIVECGPSDAKGISRVVDAGTEVFVSVIEAQDEAISAAVADLDAAGYANVNRVTPVGHSLPPAPQDRSVA